MSGKLTERQIQILRWLDENPSTRARWLVDGKEPSGKCPPEKWTHFEISGANGSIRIAAADVAATQVYRSVCPSADKMYGVNIAGRAALKSNEGDDAG